MLGGKAGKRGTAQFSVRMLTRKFERPSCRFNTTKVVFPSAARTLARSAGIMTSKRAPHSPSPASHQRMHKPLLALHAALEVDALWRAVLTLLRSEFDPHRVTLFLGHLGHGEARFVRTDPPIDRVNEWYSARGRVNPFSAFIDAHPGLKFYRFSEVLPPRTEFVATEFYRRFAQPEGWDKGLSVLFWEGESMRAMLSLYRAPAQADFSDEEFARLEYLYPFIETAIVRVQHLHAERLARRSLEEFAWNIPLGIVLLDWDLQVEFANPEARRACAGWNLGPEAARAFNPRDIFAVPDAVLAGCRALRDTILARDPKQCVSLPGDAAAIEHPDLPGERARITVLNGPASTLAPPRFLIVLGKPPPAAADSAEPAAKFSGWQSLTPSEREIARLVCAGHGNAEIARQLKKSVLTVKTQLNSAFRKLGVTSRTKLMTVLR